MKADRQRFGTGGLGQADAGADLQALRRADDDPVAEHSLDMRHPHRRAHEAHVEAMLLQPLAAIGAVVAGVAGVDRDAVAHGKAADPGADLDHRPGGLVAKDDRLSHPDRAEAAVLIVMQVRPADTARADRHQRLAGAGGGDGGGFDPDVGLGMKAADAGLHGVS